MLGYQHKRINTTIGIVFTIPVVLYFLLFDFPSNFYILNFPCGLMFSTYLAHSDFDQKRKGVIGVFWRLYADNMKHRSFFSHVPVICTLIRDFYITIFIMPIILIYYFFSPIKLTSYRAICIFVFGQIIADSVHYILDITSTEVKVISTKRKNTKRKKKATWKDYF